MKRLDYLQVMNHPGPKQTHSQRNGNHIPSNVAKSYGKCIRIMNKEKFAKLEMRNDHQAAG